MKPVKFAIVAAGLICFSVLFPNIALARSHFYIGFGTSVIHDHSGFCIGCPPHYRWYRGYHSWPGYYWRGPLYSSRVNIWVEDCYPVLVSPPVIEVSKAITKDCIYKPRYDQDTAKLFERLRHQKDEFLKTLKEGTSEQQKEAIAKLAGFSFDDTVRVALEEVLLSSPDPQLRKAVAISLGQVKNTKVLPALEKAKAQDPDQQVREEADKAIKKING
jgi:hypothetical protein